MLCNRIDRRRVLHGLSATSAATIAGALGAPPARAAGPVQLISHRYPALEFWAEKMKTAVQGVTVNAQLMPFDKVNELANIQLSAKADTIDLLYTIDSSVITYAKNGWLRPLDELWAKYKAEFKLDDYADAAVRAGSYQGRIYMVPATVNAMMFFYRKDLFDQAGKKPPTTLAEYQALAKEFHTPMRAGTINCMKPVDATLNEIHWYLGTQGAAWFDDKWRPTFNSDNGVKAITMMIETTRFAQRGFATAANDECTIALQQDTATMGMQWATRARAMDDAKQSKVLGKIDWAPMPGGGARTVTDGYSLSAFSKQDPDTLFRILAATTAEANMREAAGLLLPPRKSILSDPALREKNRFYPAAAAALDSGKPFPPLPEFYAVGEFIARRVLQAVTGEMTVKAALDTAAQETEAFLKGRGYYK